MLQGKIQRALMIWNNVDLFEFVNIKLADPELQFNKLILYITSCTIVVLDKPMLNKQIKDNWKSVTFVLKSCKFIKQNMLKWLEELSSCLSSLEKIQLKDWEEGFIRLIPAFFTIASKKYHLRRMKFTFARKTTKDDVYNQEYIFEAKNWQLKIIDEFEDTEITVYADYYKVKIIDIVKVR